MKTTLKVGVTTVPTYVFEEYISAKRSLPATSMESTKRKQEDSDNLDGEETLLRMSKKAKPNANGSHIKIGSESDDAPPANSSSSAALDLPALLDFSSFHDECEISDRFDEIARILMHEYHLVVILNGVETAFEIQEMEFYLQKAKCHEDPFTHGSEEQRVSGRWYVRSIVIIGL